MPKNKNTTDPMIKPSVLVVICPVICLLINYQINAYILKSNRFITSFHNFLHCFHELVFLIHVYPMPGSLYSMKMFIFFHMGVRIQKILFLALLKVCGFTSVDQVNWISPFGVAKGIIGEFAVIIDHCINVCFPFMLSIT